MNYRSNFSIFLLIIGILSPIYNYSQNPSSTRTYVNKREAVDLGLSVKWATCNVGAIDPEESGNYYSWGETKTKATYPLENIAYKEGKEIAAGDISGSKSDIATLYWGEGWRMPNLEEATELVNKCKWEWQIINGRPGYKVIGPNGNSIFLPAAGYIEGNDKEEDKKMGFYWTSTRKIANTQNAFTLNFMNNPSYETKCGIGVYARPLGLVIRPVTGNGINNDASFLAIKSGTHNDHDYVDLGLSVKWSTCNIGANTPSDYGDYYARGDSLTNKEYFWPGNYKHNHKYISRTIDELSGTEYDVATTKWGGKWRTPTEKEAKELITKCKWEPVKINGHYGLKVTGPNGNSIFLPGAGQRYESKGFPNDTQECTGRYWTTGIAYDTDEFYRVLKDEILEDGRSIYVHSISAKPVIETTPGYFGLTIRPVLTIE